MRVKGLKRIKEDDKMACGCNKTNNTDRPTVIEMPDGTRKIIMSSSKGTPGDKKGGPLEQCLFCAQKHADEALVTMNEFMYEQENRSFVHGSIRSVVNHTFKDWPAIASVTREAALLWQEARFKEAQVKLKEAAARIDAELLAANPEIQARIDEAKEKPDTESAPGE